jgi:RNA polymerase sigma-70 factor (ECF subfamily)
LESDHIKRLKRGDKKTFEKVFNEHYASLLVVARRYVADTSTAEDIVHNVFTKLWEKREKLRIEESLTAYLVKSVQNASMNYLKHLRVEDNYSASLLLKASEADYTATPSAILIGEEQRKEIKRLIDQLPEKCGQVFKLSRFHSMKNKEISSLLNISVRTVENQIHRALKILKEQLKS